MYLVRVYWVRGSILKVEKYCIFQNAKQNSQKELLFTRNIFQNEVQILLSPYPAEHGYTLIWKNPSVDPDHLASLEPTNQELHCF